MNFQVTGDFYDLFFNLGGCFVLVNVVNQFRQECKNAFTEMIDRNFDSTVCMDIKRVESFEGAF